MNIVEKIKALLKEAELFHSMGLLNESMEKYDKVLELIQDNKQLKRRINLITGILKKYNTLEQDMRKIEAATDRPEVSTKVQDLIKKLFTASEDKDQDAVAIDGAIALAKFGQHERALLEFKELLTKDSVRVVAAKNIIRCHMTSTSVDDAVDQYEQWLSSDLFVSGELNKLRFFLESLLKKEGVEKKLPAAEMPAAIPEPTIEMPGSEDLIIKELEIEEDEDSDIEELKIEEDEDSDIEELEVEEDEDYDSEELKSGVNEDYDIEELEVEEAVEFFEDEDYDDEILDINSIVITLDSGPQKGNTVELDVSFQSGNVISLRIKQTDYDLIEQFNVGETLHNIQFYSPIAMFGGSVIVDAKMQIESGPRCGDYSIDLKVVST